MFIHHSATISNIMHALFLLLLVRRHNPFLQYIVSLSVWWVPVQRQGAGEERPEERSGGRGLAIKRAVTVSPGEEAVELEPWGGVGTRASSNDGSGLNIQSRPETP